MSENPFDKRRQDDPQGLIDDLVKQTARQAAEINRLNQRIAELEGKKKKDGK
jgi:hypothetical protein